MKPISGMDYDAARPSVPISGERGPQKIQRPEDGSKECRPKPVMDEYVPEEEEEPSGGYWLGKDDEGRPKICTVSTEDGTSMSNIWKCIWNAHPESMWN